MPVNLKKLILKNIEKIAGKSMNRDAEIRKIFLLIGFSFIGCGSLIVFGLVNIANGIYEIGYIELLLALLTLVNLFYLRIKGSVRLATSVVLILMAITLWILLTTGGIQNTGIFWYFTYPVLALILKDLRRGWGWIILVVLITLVTGIAAEFGLISIPFEFIEVRQLIASFFVVSLMVSVFAFILNSESKKLGESLLNLESELHKRSVLEVDLRDKNQKLERVKKSVLNILDDLKTEKENLLREKNKIDTILLSLADGLIVTDEVGRIILVNEAFTTLLGNGESDAEGKHLIDEVKMYDDKGNEIAQENRPLTKVLSGEIKEISNQRFYYEGSNGRRFPSNISVAPIRFNDNLIGAVEVFRDVTEEVDHLSEIERFKLAVENATDQIVITDPDGLVIFANQALKRITGYEPSEIIGQKAGKAWGGLMDPEYYKNLWETIKVKKDTFTSQIKNKRKNGEEYYAEVHISPILNDSNDIQFFVAIERDITKEKEVDMAKTEFVSLASHQLRTPLTAIRWYCESLLSGDGGKLNDQQEEFLQEIYKGNQRMVDLVNALLNVSRIDLGTFAIEPELSKITDISEVVLKELESTISEKKLKLHKNYGEIPEIPVDPKLMNIIFQNLLSNAVKYTPENGEIWLDIYAEDPNLVIKVKDTGYGIPESQKDKIFQKLFRADNVKQQDTEGTGLGLYIVKSILEKSDGSISFVSEENKGTEFTVLLPLSGMKKTEGSKSLS